MANWEETLGKTEDWGVFLTSQVRGSCFLQSPSFAGQSVLKRVFCNPVELKCTEHFEDAGRKGFVLQGRHADVLFSPSKGNRTLCSHADTTTKAKDQMNEQP
ncbi:unnamed protein product [Gadus morhua 'NCC']